MKHANPHRLFAKLNQRKNSKQQAFAEINKGYNDVVDHDPYPHIKSITTLVDAKRVSFGYIVFRFIHIRIAKHLADEGRILPRRKITNGIKKKEDKKRKQHHLPVPVHREWHLVFPKAQQKVAFFFPVLVNTQVYFSGQCINIAGYPASRIKRFGVTEVVNQLYKIFRCFIGIGGGALLDFFPTGLVLFYKKSFSQISPI
jgi:hypothetical protein